MLVIKNSAYAKKVMCLRDGWTDQTLTDQITPGCNCLLVIHIFAIKKKKISDMLLFKSTISPNLILEQINLTYPILTQTKLT